MDADAEPDVAAALQRVGPRPLDALDQRLLDDVRERVLGRRQLPRTIERFTVLEEIGRGGMGTVYAAYDPRLDRRIALKVLVERGDAAREAVLTEARMLGRIGHPNVATVHDAGEVDDRVYVAMELVQGVTLPRWLEQEDRARDAIVGVLDQAGRGLAAAHAAGLVHRDFKPANVVVGDDGRARVIDFGLALDVESARASASTAGTPAYMAPEQFEGLATDARTDQYAFCLVAAQALGATRQEPGPPGLTGLPPRLARVLERGLHPEPDRRFADMAALLVAMQQSRRSRWWPAATVLTLATTAAVVVAARNADEGSSCATAAQRRDTLWTTAQRDAVTTALGTTPEAQDAVARFDRQAEGWAQASHALCDETTETSPTAVSQCLQLWSVEFRELTTLLAEADARLRKKGARIASNLESWERCRNPSTLLDPVTSPQATAIREQLARARARLVAGDSVDARARAEQAATTARQTEHRLVEAEALEVLGRAMSYDRAFEDAAVTLRSAATLAIEIGADPVLSDSATMLSYVLSQTDDAKRGLDWIEVARAARRRQGLPASETSLDTKEAVLLTLLGRTDEAIAAYEAALATADPDDTYTTIMVRGNLANALWASGRLEDARAENERALHAAEQRLGPDHPVVASALLNLAGVQSSLKQTEQALASTERAHAIRRGAQGEDHPALGQTFHRLALLSYDLDRFEDALKYSSRALPLLQQSLGPRTLRVAAAQLLRGAALGAQGRVDEAWPDYREAIEVMVEVDAPSEDQVRTYLWAVTGAVAAHEYAQAITWAEAGLAIADERDEHILLEWLLAEALAARGDAAPRVEQLRHRIAQAEANPDDEQRLSEHRAVLADYRTAIAEHRASARDEEPATAPRSSAPPVDAVADP